MEDGLFDYERRDMIEAVRRDMHAEEERASTDPQWREWHMENVRKDKRILDVVNPKRHAWQ